VHVKVARNFSCKKITATDMKAIALSILGWQFSNASAESVRPMCVGVERTFDGIITVFHGSMIQTNLNASLGPAQEIFGQSESADTH
jgi:hypothetical protein